MVGVVPLASPHSQLEGNFLGAESVSFADAYLF